ncbi:hypothetical protein LPJ66_006663 [Kickxella alabastrina]|uniref:Uncharacterized protein n=1 Tax=Kickxella alabastrina TaxID=61397 RepID=A0ACC1IF17_9FUNG|nr:hypothetical protein LPJ66_006663 [Kickxella alabastrina]
MRTRQLTLTNGLQMPSFGLGTWQQRDPDTVKRVVRQALDVGYRLIDTASVYRNEQAIGEALATAFCNQGGGLLREDVWITSKLAPKQQGYEGAMAAVLGSLENLQTDYIDLYLIHWPGASGKALESPEHRSLRQGSWQALEELYAQGKVRAIGVSNYTKRHLQEMRTYAKVTPMVNQCEMHPLCPQFELLKYCKDNGIVFTAYASLGEAALLNDNQELPELRSVACRRPDLSLAQILLMWGLQHGAAVIPKASSMARLQENMSALDKVSLSADDMDGLDSVSQQRQKHFCWSAENVA